MRPQRHPTCVWHIGTGLGVREEDRGPRSAFHSPLDVMTKGGARSDGRDGGGDYSEGGIFRRAIGLIERWMAFCRCAKCGLVARRSIGWREVCMVDIVEIPSGIDTAPCLLVETLTW